VAVQSKCQTNAFTLRAVTAALVPPAVMCNAIKSAEIANKI